MKQVIVMRKDLNMRKGKMIAQGAHASLSAYLIADEKTRDEWWNSGQTKICVYVNSEQELLDVWRTASHMRLDAYIVRDAGHTEFNGIPTLTCCAIGPASNDLVDKVTGHLPLL